MESRRLSEEFFSNGFRREKLPRVPNELETESYNSGLEIKGFEEDFQLFVSSLRSHLGYWELAKQLGTPSNIGRKSIEINLKIAQTKYQSLMGMTYGYHGVNDFLKKELYLRLRKDFSDLTQDVKRVFPDLKF